MFEDQIINVMYAVLLMLVAIFAYEALKTTYLHYQDYELKRECYIHEDREFEKETRTTFRKLREAYERAEKQKEE